MVINEFLDILKEDKRVLYIYQYGSSVYGVQSEDSDTDFLVITTEDFEIPENFLTFVYEREKVKDQTILRNLKYENCDFIFYTTTEWFNMATDNCIEVFECAVLPKKYIHKEYVKLYPILDLVKLRKEISAICSNAWVKGKKKLAQGDNYIGKKSIWHSLRVAIFGIQIAENKKIINYKAANKYYEDIVLSDCNDWNYYESKYKELSNNLRTEFRKVTEGAWTQYCKNKILENNKEE